MKYVLLASSMVLAIIGQFLLKRGVLASSLEPNFLSIAKTVFSPLVLLGFIMYGASSMIWLFVLQKFPLSVAYPALSLTYVVIVILSFLFLKEPVTSFKTAGLVLIVLGVYFLFK
jgi:multidrug transporter EmrE-like cation transporter